MQIVSLILLVLMILLFIGSLATGCTVVYALFGVISLFILRGFYSRPGVLEAAIIGVKAAFWPYILSIIAGILFFHTCVICPGRHCGGLIFIPVISGFLTVLFNLIPDFGTHKPEFQSFKELFKHL